jgi:hypothetical protein
MKYVDNHSRNNTLAAQQKKADCNQSFLRVAMF